MSELIEMVFEGVNKNNVKSVLQYFNTTKLNYTLINVFLNNNESLSITSIDDVDTYISANSIKSVLVKCKKVYLVDDYHLEDVNVWIYIRNEMCNIELDFDLNFSTNNKPLLVDKMIIFSKKISGLFKAKYFYSGLSPACDEETRLFTQCNVGPISLNYKK